MKNIYETPTMKTVILSDADLITTSPLNWDEEGSGGSEDW